MADDISLDGRTLAGVANSEAGEVSGATRFEFEQTGDRIYAHYAGRVRTSTFSRTTSRTAGRS